MRQYRGKTLDGEWVKGDLITEKDTNDVIKRAFIHLRLSPIEFNGDSLSSRIVLHEVDPKTVGQYTGENLKKGTEVYEGDVYQYEIEISIGDYSKKSYHTDTVYFKDGIYWVGGFTLHEAIENEDGKIIGNIHENPELLKVTSKLNN